jgi:hypothetical protein
VAASETTYYYVRSLSTLGTVTSAKWREMSRDLEKGIRSGAGAVGSSTRHAMTVEHTFQAKQTDPEQSWYWTAEWQAQERAAEEDIQAGRCKESATMAEFLASLKSLMDQ